jgi:hypothetical protein
MYIEKQGQLYDIHPSSYIDTGSCFMFLKKVLDISIAKKVTIPRLVPFMEFWRNKKSRKQYQQAIFPAVKLHKEKRGKWVINL